MPITLISHHLCPYVQRAAITLAENDIAFERIYIDLAAKPAWFNAISPLGKVPLLRVGDQVVFESAVILEYLEDTTPHPLHPADPLTRAHHRAWIEFASAVLNDIAGLYNAPDADAFAAAVEKLRAKFTRLEAELTGGPWFAGNRFSLVDAAFGPVFRYFEVFDRIGSLAILDGLPRMAAWRGELAVRASVRNAVTSDYADRLLDFLSKRNSHLSSLVAKTSAPTRPDPVAA